MFRSMHEQSMTVINDDGLYCIKVTTHYLKKFLDKMDIIDHLQRF
jgi:hypothetical protein